MPETPPPRLRSSAENSPLPSSPSDRSVPAYAELHCCTNYSFLEGASHADELVSRAVELGYRALAITDRNSLAGVVRAYAAAKETELRLLIGAEIVPSDGPAMVLLPTDRTAYGLLSRLITTGRRRAAKGSCRIGMSDVLENSDGLICCVPLSTESRLRREGGYAPEKKCLLSDSELKKISEAFGDRCYALAELHHGPRDARILSEWLEQTQRLNIPLAAANDVHYHVPRRRALHDVVTAIRLNRPLASLGHELFPNGERHLKSPVEILRLMQGHEELLQRTVEIADRCQFNLSELKYEYPEELVPEGFTPFEYLSRLTSEGAAVRFPKGVPEKVRRLIEHEFAIIRDMRYEAYFLTVHDLVRFARQRGILCQGRGSAANSVVCFCLGVTSVDPSRIDVLFERFISRERNEAPDIDIDFEHERREEVLQYLYERYGRDRAGMTGVVITYRPRSAIRDIARAFGMSQDRIDRLASQMDHVDQSEQFPERLREGGIEPESRTGRQILELLDSLMGFPRHLSQHVGGMVMARGLLSELVPIENASMMNRTVIQWDKDDLDVLGLLKVDCLSLGMLSCIRKTFDLIQLHHARQWALATIPAEDPAVYDMICAADTVGVFQIESRAQMSMLPRLKPRCFYDLVIEVAIVRPGPIQGDMVHPYLRRRSGEEPVEFPSAEVRSVLHRTLGVPIFQEQAMRLAIVAAGFTPGEADQLRRAMGAWRKVGVIDRFHQKLVQGMLQRGYTEEFAERVFQQISGFGEYGFPESHAASFALLVYVSAWLKRYHPAAFCAALINSQPMGFYAPAQLIRDAKAHGVSVLPIDVNHSLHDCTLEDTATEEHQGTLDSPSARHRHGAGQGSPDHLDRKLALRLGLRLLHGLPEEIARRIETERSRKGPFRTIQEFARRVQVGRSTLRLLSGADAFASLKPERRDALWISLPPGETLPLLEAAGLTDEDGPVPELPEMTPQEQVVADYSAAGFSLKAHPVSFLRESLIQLKVVSAEELPMLTPDRRIRVAGLILMRQRPATASGITFVTLEDETGISNLVIYPSVWQKFRQAARFASVLLATGRLQREGDVIHIVCDRLDDLSEMLQRLAPKSRDFR